METHGGRCAALWGSMLHGDPRGIFSGALWGPCCMELCPLGVRAAYPLCSEARGSWLLRTLIMSREKSRKNMAMPKQVRYTALQPTSTSQFTWPFTPGSDDPIPPSQKPGICREWGGRTADQSICIDRALITQNIKGTRFTISREQKYCQLIFEEATLTLAYAKNAPILLNADSNETVCITIDQCSLCDQISKHPEMSRGRGRATRNKNKRREKLSQNEQENT